MKISKVKAAVAVGAAVAVLTLAGWFTRDFRIILYVDTEEQIIYEFDADRLYQLENPFMADWDAHPEQVAHAGDFWF